MNGGAVKLDRSPENEAILVPSSTLTVPFKLFRGYTHDLTNWVQEPRWAAGTASPASFGSPDIVLL